MKLTEKGAAIEAKKTRLMARRFNPRPPKYCPKLKIKIFRFKITRSGNAEITAELSPKEAKYYTGEDASVHLNLRDKLVADSIFGFSDKTFPDPNVNMASGRHQSQFIDTRSYTVAEIEVPMREYLHG